MCRDGRVFGVDVLEADPDGLAAFVRYALEEWSFRPARKDAHRVAARKRLVVNVPAEPRSRRD